MSESTLKQRSIVAFTILACACLGLVAAVTVFIPSSAVFLEWLQTPEGLKLVGGLALLFGTPIIGAVLGICIGGRAIQRMDPSTEAPGQPV